MADAEPRRVASSEDAPLPLSDSAALSTLCFTAAGIGFFHTVAGPDHYIPFIAMARAGEWSRRKTALITLLCGVGHVLSSVVLGFIGIAFGMVLARLTAIESVRGDLAAWALLAFGLVYFAWGWRRAVRSRTHAHGHVHTDGASHEHFHEHRACHVHVHPAPGRSSLTPWVLFTVFVFGPCEPLIPLLMYPAAKDSLAGTALVAGVFSVVTIGTMLTVVTLASMGLTRLPTRAPERYAHALAGGAIALCGAGILFLGV